MWVLIVSAFRTTGAPTPEETRELNEFEAAVHDAMAAGSKGVRIDSKELTELGDLLFAPRWGYSEDKALVAFDHLDMIFFRGSTSVLPWYKTARQALLLLHQCILCHTPTFVCGFGAQLASYCLTTDALVTNVLNGFGCGSPLKDIVYLGVPDRTQFDHDVKSFDMFLDEATGDLYSYHHGLNGWVPYVNCGFRRSNTRFEDNKRATASMTFRADTTSIQAKLATAFSSGHNDVVVHTLNRWNSAIMAALGGYRDFKALAKSNWVINESLLDAKYGSGNIRVLAEHEIKGVMVYEFGDLFVCNFSVLDKYPESIVLLNSFIANKLKLLEIQGSGRSGAAFTTLKSTVHENFTLVTDVGEGTRVLSSRLDTSRVTLRRRSVGGGTTVYVAPAGTSGSGSGGDSSSTSNNNSNNTQKSVTSPQEPPTPTPTDGHVSAMLSFKPSQRLVKVCPELAGWHVPDVLVKKQQAKRKYTKWAAVKSKVLELAREVIRSHPKPKPKVNALEVVSAFKAAATAKIRWSEAPPTGPNGAASSAGRFKTLTIHRSDDIQYPVPNAGTVAALMRLSYSRRNGLEGPPDATTTKGSSTPFLLAGGDVLLGSSTRVGTGITMNTTASSKKSMAQFTLGKLTAVASLKPKSPAHIRRCQPKMVLKSQRAVMPSDDDVDVSVESQEAVDLSTTSPTS